MPADFYQDTFTVSTDTALASHTPELGGTYSFATDLRPATSATVAAATDRLSFPTAAITVAKNSVVVPNANYSLSGFIVVGVNGDFRFDAMLRKVDLTGYYFFCNTGSMSILLDSDAGTVLASATPPSMNVAAGLIPFTLSAIGSTISFTMGAVTINATNSARTAAGEFIFGGRDVEFDTLSGVDPDASGDTTAPTLSSPTGTGGTLTGTWSVSSTEAGTLYFRTTPTSTPATVPAVPGAMTGWSSVAMTAGVNTGSFGALTAGTHFPQFAADDGASPVNRTAVAAVGSSFVVTATPATARPASDVTTAGWTASTGTNFAALLDEVSPSDADFITSPPLSGSTAPVTVALDTVLIAGSWAIGVRARTTSGAGTVRVYLLNDAGTVVGTSGLQAITSTFATYSLPVATSGIATRARIETLSS